MFTQVECLIQVVKVLNDYFLLPMRIRMQLQSILRDGTFFRELKLKITTLKLTEEIFMINELMT